MIKIDEINFVLRQFISCLMQFNKNGMKLVSQFQLAYLWTQWGSSVSVKVRVDSVSQKIMGSNLTITHPVSKYP
jgi:hypothetical protein